MRRAIGTVGLRKIGTAFETASTPVMAVQPLAKARTRIQAPIASVGSGSAGGATTDIGCPPLATDFENTDRDHRAESCHKQIGWHHEDQP